jgi:antitoxin (DNA-binding transcriptional repressor) of toxin-antitoxin stability system
MKRASVRELHINTSKWVREASEGGIIVIESRGKPVAELRPVGPRRPSRAEIKRIFAEMEKIWASMPLMPDSGKILEEDRDR